MSFERCARRGERLRRPAQIARSERDLRLGQNTPGASHRLIWTEGARGAPQQLPRSGQIAQLRHSDAPKRERRGIIA